MSAVRPRANWADASRDAVPRSPRTDAIDLLIDLYNAGAILTVDGDTIRIRGPRKAQKPSLLRRAEQHKDGLIALLRERDQQAATGWVWRGGRWVWAPGDPLVRHAEERLGGLVTEVRPLRANPVDSVPPPPPQTPRRAALARWEADHRGKRRLPPSILWDCPVCRECQRTAPDVTALWCTGLASAPHAIVAMGRGLGEP